MNTTIPGLPAATSVASDMQFEVCATPGSTPTSQRVTAAQIATFVTLPSGIIVMWSGTVASIPSGWHLCDGTVSTPDLRNRFIVCADKDTAGHATSNIEGTNAQTGGTNPPVADMGAAPQDEQVQDGGDGFMVAAAGNLPLGLPVWYALAYIMKL